MYILIKDHRICICWRNVAVYIRIRRHILPNYKSLLASLVNNFHKFGGIIQMHKKIKLI